MAEYTILVDTTLLRDIVARGTQDMKSVCAQYVLAVKNLKRSGFTPRRTIHMTFVPDEEVLGSEGMGLFVDNGHLDKLKVGVALDEGIANPTPGYTVFYGERATWWVKVRAKGPTGHASRFIKNTAVEKLVRTIAKFLDYRKEQSDLLDQGGCKHAVARKLGDVTTLNLTVLNAGVTMDGGKTYAMNVVPNVAEAGFDIRLPPTMPMETFEEKLKEFTKEDGVKYSFVYRVPEHSVTSISEKENPWWGVFSSTTKRMGLDVEPEIFPAATDSRFLRQVGIPAFGFSPMNNTEVLLHDHNERLNKDVFLKGIPIYEEIIKSLSSVERFEPVI